MALGIISRARMFPATFSFLGNVKQKGVALQLSGLSKCSTDCRNAIFFHAPQRKLRQCSRQRVKCRTSFSLQQEGRTAVEDLIVVLERKSLGELRAIGRQLGIHGATTRKELVHSIHKVWTAAKPGTENGGDDVESSLLSTGEAPSLPPVIPQPASVIPAADVASILSLEQKVATLEEAAQTPAVFEDAALAEQPAVTEPLPLSVAEAEVGAKNIDEILNLKSTAELRALARERGIRGDTRRELLNELLKDKTSLVSSSETGELVAEEVKGSSPRVWSDAVVFGHSRSGAALLEEQPQATNVIVDTRTVDTLPPFASESQQEGVTGAASPAGLPSALPEEQQMQMLLKEVAVLREAMAAMEEREKASTEEKTVLEEEAKLLKTGMLGAAALALGLPMLMLNSALPRVQPLNPEQAEFAQQSASLLESLLRSQASALDEIQELIPLVAPATAPDVKLQLIQRLCTQTSAVSRSSATQEFCDRVM